MRKPRALVPGDRLAIVAPASPFDREEFDRGVDEIRRLGFEPVYDDSVFARQRYVAGSAGAARGGDSRGLARSVDRRPDRRSRRLRQRAGAAAARSRRGAARPQAVHRLQRSDGDADVPDARLRPRRVSRPDARGPAWPRRGRATTRDSFMSGALPARTDGRAGAAGARDRFARAKRPGCCSAGR